MEFNGHKLSDMQVGCSNWRTKEYQPSTILSCFCWFFACFKMGICQHVFYRMLRCSVSLYSCPPAYWNDIFQFVETVPKSAFNIECQVIVCQGSRDKLRDTLGTGDIWISLVSSKTFLLIDMHWLNPYSVPRIARLPLGIPVCPPLWGL